MEFPVLCLDHGLKFIGVALSYSGHFAEPLIVIRRTTKAADFAKINGLIAQHKARSILLGLPPTPPTIQAVPQSVLVRNWAGRLADAMPLPIYFWDEGMSSADAASLLTENGSRLPNRVDAHAAAVILQTCLDAMREGTGTPERFEKP